MLQLYDGEEQEYLICAEDHVSISDLDGEISANGCFNTYLASQVLLLLLSFCLLGHF